MRQEQNFLLVFWHNRAIRQFPERGKLALITAAARSSNRNIRSFGVSTMIMLSNNTISATAVANGTIGTLSLVDSSGTVQKANWGLTAGAADCFLTSGNVLATARASIQQVSTPSTFAQTPNSCR